MSIKSTNDPYRAIQLHKVLHRTNILKVYDRKAVTYGPYIEVHKYSKVRVTRKSPRLFYTKSSTGKKTSRSLQRARSNIYKIIEANVHQHGNYEPVFFTLTFAENNNDLQECNRRFKQFIQRLNYSINANSNAPLPLRHCRYITVPEFQKRGAVHYHGIFFNLPFIDVRTLRTIWGHGYIDVQVTRTLRSAGRYLCKYLTKDIIDSRLYGQKLYFTSKGLFRPQQYFSPLDIDTILDTDTLEVLEVYRTPSYYKIDYIKHV